jgi:hypothetical protein
MGFRLFTDSFSGSASFLLVALEAANYRITIAG